jgi:aspartyl-tRNA(Asn)/glutamyl-tRNA(Gln) amidotransferase subunit A
MSAPIDTARSIREAVAGGSRSASDVCRRALDRIREADRQLNSFRFVDEDGAMARAAELDARRGELTDLPLLGVPIAVKDNICTKRMPTTAASKILEGYYPPYDATVVERLEAAGAVIVGKTNCDEFAMGSSTENSAYGITRNPWNLERIPGGSSGGSAAAVAAGLVPLALGSDTGGSIRQPAALCGITGLKPTYGRVPRYGLLAFASSLDQIGPIAATVEDAALAFSVIAGHDPQDATSASSPLPDVTNLPASLRGVRVGVPRALMTEGVEPGVLAAVEGALAVLEEQGAVLKTIDLPHSRHGIAAYYLIATAEASSNLARYDGVRYGVRAPGDERTVASMYESTRGQGFGAEVKRRIMLGTYVLSAGYYDAYYLKAQQIRTLIGRDYDAAFDTVDVIALPTSPTGAFRLGERTSDPVLMYLADVFTVGANLAGVPAITVPCGFAGENLPVGLQLTARKMDEARLLGVAAAYQHATDWHERRPPVPIAARN